jgi:hypothetical protein
MTAELKMDKKQSLLNNHQSQTEKDFCNGGAAISCEKMDPSA